MLKAIISTREWIFLSNTGGHGCSNSEVSPPSRILVPTDGSENSMRALRKAINLASAFHSELFVVNVIPAPGLLVGAPIAVGIPSSFHEYYHEQEGAAKNVLAEGAALCKKYGMTSAKTQLVRAEKSVVDEIVEMAAYRKIDLIVIGTRGLGGFKKLLMGSVSSGVVTHASCDVLVVR